jgi:hypothetical protein
MICIIYILIILLIAIIPNLNNNNKVQISILVNNTISKILLLLFILFISLEDVPLGLLLIILYFTILLNKSESIEGFQNYFSV